MRYPFKRTVVKEPGDVHAGYRKPPSLGSSHHPPLLGRYVALSRGRAANHLYVPDDIGDGGTPRVEDDRHLDRLAAQLAVRHNQTLATRQLPVANRWQAVSNDTPSRRVEGLYR